MEGADESTELWQQEVIRSKARFKPISTKKSEADREIIKCQCR